MGDLVFSYVSKDAEDMKLQILIRIESEANKREHWAVRNKRKNAQQAEFSAEWKKAKFKPTLPCKVIFTRHGCNLLDTDNLAIGFKAVRDQLARELNINDGDERLKFIYKQEKLSKRQYFITVEILND